jgi:methionyl aminopeptidase
MSEILKTHPARHQAQVHPGLRYSEEIADEEAEKLLLEAGKLASQVRDEIAKLTVPGANVLELCKKADDLIYSQNAVPAFPINISISDVAAHYTGQINDDLIIPAKGVVKIDCGVSLNGFIADTAKSVDLDGSYTDLIKASIDATEAAIEIIRPGSNLGKIGGVIEKTIKEAGFQPIKELRGHLIERYIVHAGKSVPNIFVDTNETVELGEVYAIEPFATTGQGSVHADFNTVNIFRAAPIKIPLRSKHAKKVLRLAVQEFGGMPFAERWLLRHNMSVSEVKVGMMELRKAGAMIEYHVLRAATNEDVVAQNEHTMIIKEEEAFVTTR